MKSILGLKVLKDHGWMNEFQRIGIILPNGKSDGQYVTGKNFADYEYFQRAMNGEIAISNVLIDRSTSLPVIKYMVPVFKEGKVVAVLGAVINVEDFEEVLSLSSFDSKGYSYIINNDGNVIVHSKNLESIAC